MHLVIFEDPAWVGLAPLTLSRPAFLLMCGTTRLLEAWIAMVKPTRVTLWVRPEMAGYCRRFIVPEISVPTSVNTPLDNEAALLINARSMPNGGHLPTEPSVAMENGSVAVAHVKSPGLQASDLLQPVDPTAVLSKLPPFNSPATLFNHLWNLLDANPAAITRAAEHLRPSQLPAGSYHLIEAQRVFIAPGVVIQPGVVLDASEGPIILDVNVFVGANSVLVGPLFVERGSRINALSHVGHGTSIGPVCKVGGEISSSIILGYSNKQHDGYLGDSYLGEWVNFGAGTTTANLKATYSPVSARVASENGSIVVPTSRRSLGSMVGDHTKTAIGTRFSPGSYIGYCSVLATSKTIPAHVPSYRFVTDEGMTNYDATKHPEVAARVMARRHCEWNADDRSIADFVAGKAPGIEK